MDKSKILELSYPRCLRRGICLIHAVDQVLPVSLFSKLGDIRPSFETLIKLGKSYINMSIHLIITPYPPDEWENASSDLSIDVENFSNHLIKNWENATYDIDENGGLSWVIPEENNREGFHGRLHPNHQIVTFVQGTRTTMFDFILWYRHQVPAKYDLYFFASNTWDSLLLTEDTTKTDIEIYFKTKT